MYKWIAQMIRWETICNELKVTHSVTLFFISWMWRPFQRRIIRKNLISWISFSLWQQSALHVGDWSRSRKYCQVL